jgi:hypothetical protein
MRFSSPPPIRSTCPTHLILLNTITVVTFSEEYKLQS